jgi:hypothetical protein
MMTSEVYCCMTEVFIICVFGTKNFSKSSGSKAEKLVFHGYTVSTNDILASPSSHPGI